MSTALARNRDAVVVEADSQCELVLDGARCAQGGRAVEVHHVTYRSAGGGHEESNLLPVCHAHHRQHHDGHLKGPHHDPDGLTFYAETHKGQRRRWYVFREIREQLESEVQEAEAMIYTGRAMGTRSAYLVGEGFRRLRDRNLWALCEVDVDPTDPRRALSEYAAYCGFAESTVYSMLKVAERLAALPEGEREEWTQVAGGFSIWKNAGKHLEAMGEGDRVAVLERAREQPVSAVVDSVREEFGREDSPRGEREAVEVEFRVEGTAFQRVTRQVGESDEETIQEARKRLAGDQRFRVELTRGVVRGKA